MISGTISVCSILSGSIATWQQQTGATPPQVYDFGYDRVDQLEAATLQTTDPTPVLLKRYRYAYDPAGNRTVEQIDDAATGATYDDMNRLVSQQAGGSLLFQGSTNEPATVTVEGQQASSTETTFAAGATVPSGTSQVTVQASDGSGNVRTNVYEVAQTGAAVSFTYDDNGNATGKTEGGATTTYEWDAENRLLAVKQGGSTLASFTYDGEGRRYTKTTSAGTLTYVNNGANVL